MMIESSIFSIGHGNKDMNDFIAELKSNGITYLLDIRSKPYSKWYPQFNQDSLSEELKLAGITYVFVGDTLGGLPSDSTCYDEGGKVIYDRIKERDFFKQGLSRLTTANEKHIPVAMMCSEAKPEECHRSKLIGQVLLDMEISVKHIVGQSKIKSQEQVMLELNKGKNTTDLFGDEKDFTSRKSY